MATKSVCASVCLSSVTCVHPTQRFNFSGIFLHHIVAWPSGNSTTKNHEDRPRGSPLHRGLNRKGVVKQANLAYGIGLVTYLLSSKPNSHVWLSHLLLSFLLYFMVPVSKHGPARYIGLRFVQGWKRCFRSTFLVCMVFLDIIFSCKFCVQITIRNYYFFIIILFSIYIYIWI